MCGTALGSCAADVGCCCSAGRAGEAKGSWILAYPEGAMGDGARQCA